MLPSTRSFTHKRRAAIPARLSLVASKPRPSQDRTALSLSAIGSKRTATMHPFADLFLGLGEDRESRVVFLVGRVEAFHWCDYPQGLRGSHFARL